MHIANSSSKTVMVAEPKLASFEFSQSTGGYNPVAASLKNRTWRQIFIKAVHIKGEFTVSPSIPKVLQPNETFHFQIEVGDSFIPAGENGFILIESYESDPIRIDLSQEETTGVLSPESQLQEQINGLTADVASVTGATDALNATIADLLAADGDINALIATEQQLRIDGDTALATSLDLIGAISGDSLAYILDLDSVYVSPTESLTQRFNALSSAIGDNTAAISTLSSTTATDVSAEASRIDVLQANVDLNTAAISTEESVRADADSANATLIQSLTTTVNGNTASITTQQESIDGINARYTLQLDVNGHVTGWTAENDGVTGSIVFVADQFSIVDPNGGTPITPFSIVDGVVYITNANIGTLSVSDLTGGTLTPDVDVDGDLDFGLGRIIFDNGIYMKIQGIGFGVDSQFIEWFGPSGVIESCDTSNAISYLKTNGDAYFGGSLSAGILRNAAQSTSIAADASIQIGPFDTNGNAIGVVLSYTLENTKTENYAGTAQGETDWDNAIAAWGSAANVMPGGDLDETKVTACNIVIDLDRHRAGLASDEPWNSLIISQKNERLVGLKPLAAGSEAGHLYYTLTASGSLTSTDASGGVQQRTFTATITTRTNAVYGTGAVTQNITLIATEE